MNKFFKNTISVLTTVTLVATLFVGINGASVKAEEPKDVAIKPWVFMHQGVNDWGEPDNVGVIASAKMTDTDETLTNFQLTKDYKRTATTVSKGFELNITNTGWDALWGKGPNGVDTINPWSVQTMMNGVTIEPGHMYTVSFKAHASAKKYAYMTFGTDVIGGDGKALAPYADAGFKEGSDNVLITIGSTDNTYTYNFTNWVSGTELNTTFMLGAFDAQYDYAGNDISSIVTAVENSWSGTVYVSDFTVTDNGLDPDFVPPVDKPTVAPTEKPTERPTVKPTGTSNDPVVKPTPAGVKKLAKVKKLKVKNTKKGTVKITWRKVTNAKSYQIKVGKKTYTSKKVKFTAKKLNKGKKYTIKVRAKAPGYKTSPWATKKIKIKK